MARLFEALDISPPDLLLREYGRRAWGILERELLEVPSGYALTLDLAGVSVMDTSFCEETVLQLARSLVAGQYGDRFLVLERPSPATLDNIEATIAWRRAKVALPVREGQQTRIIGHLEPNLGETWRLALEVGVLTARDLADRLGLEIGAASMRLRKLYDTRLLTRREEITSGGRQHVYHFPA